MKLRLIDVYCILKIPWDRVPYLSALEVRSRRGAIQIHVYLYLYLTRLQCQPRACTHQHTTDYSSVPYLSLTLITWCLSTCVVKTQCCTIQCFLPAYFLFV